MGTIAPRRTDVGAAVPVVHVRTFGAFEIRNAAGEELFELAGRRKARALLAYLALGGDHSVQPRERIRAIFWPEVSEANARVSLRQMLHLIRRAVRHDIFDARPNGDLGLLPGAVRADVNEFENLLNDGRPAEALTLYRGPFLDAFSLSGISQEFEWWVDRERGRLRGLALRAVETQVTSAERAGDVRSAIEFAQQHLHLDPFDERAFRRLATLLDRAGDRAGALHAYERFTNVLMRELESSPSEETKQLVDSIRASARALSARQPMATQANTPIDVVAPSVPRATDSPTGRRHTRALLALGAIVLVSIAGLAFRSWIAPRHTVLAVGGIRVHVRDSIASPTVIRELVATDLSRIDGIDVVSAERIQELMIQQRSPIDTGAAIAIGARRAGATQVLEAIVSDMGAAGYRADIHRVDLRDGTIHGAHTLEATDLFGLADRVANEVARDFGRHPPTSPLSTVTSTSLVARRFYEEGLGAFYRGDAVGGLALLERAMREDSTFVMAAFYAGRLAQFERGETTAVRYMGHARRIAARATERERLLVETAWASITNDPAIVPLAESLATRYPAEADAEYWFATALSWSGDYARAISHYRTAIQEDSVSLSELRRSGSSVAPRSCYACEAFSGLAQTYEFSDSLAAAIRVAKEWIARVPSLPDGYMHLAAALEAAGATDSALAAARIASRLAGRDLSGPRFRAILAIRRGDFVSADRIIEDQLASGEPEISIDARGWQVISLREQGRLSAALDTADVLIREERALGGMSAGQVSGTLLRAQLLFELGRAREAAQLFETIAAVPLPENHLGFGEIPGLTSRRRAWMLTHAGTAYAALNDTARLARLADTVEQLGARDAFVRDRLLHFYLRGLLFEARGDSLAAVKTFRQAIGSPNFGFTRVNYELARLLIALDRAAEAVPLLESALRGGIEGSNLYITRRELRALLTKATAAKAPRGRTPSDE